MEQKLTVAEAAKQSGMSESWWRLQIFNKTIRYIRTAGRVFIPQSTIDGVFDSIEPSQALLPVLKVDNAVPLPKEARPKEDKFVSDCHVYFQGNLRKRIPFEKMKHADSVFIGLDPNERKNRLFIETGKTIIQSAFKLFMKVHEASVHQKIHIKEFDDGLRVWMI